MRNEGERLTYGRKVCDGEVSHEGQRGMRWTEWAPSSSPRRSNDSLTGMAYLDLAASWI